MDTKIQADQKIMKLLKISDLRYHIGNTNLGSLDILLRFGEDKYTFLLDSTPVDDGTDEGKEKEHALLKAFGYA